MDVNPVAWFITKKSVEPVDIRKLKDAFRKMDGEVAPEILRWYRTRCPKGHEADVMYVFWVRTVRCSSCGKKARLFNSFRIATKTGSISLTKRGVQKGRKDHLCLLSVCLRKAPGNSRIGQEMIR